MDKRSSPITDLYGATPPEGPRKHRGRGWLLVVLLLAGLFILESIRPVMRLRPDPPPAVVGARLNSNAAENQAQDRMAQACWDYAIQSLQNRYPYGQPLPARPPLASNQSVGNAPEISVLCWPRLRIAWAQPESWVQKYEWDTDWVTDPNGPFQQTVHNITNFLTTGN